MRTTSLRSLPVMLALLVLGPLGGCGSGDGDEVAADPALAGAADSPVSDDGTAGGTAGGAGDGVDPTPPPGLPSAIPPASGPVRSLGLATVIEQRDGVPQLCLGPVAESWPPQCEGLPLAGWRWADAQGVFERDQGVRWGQFAVTGSFDGATFTVTELVPAALYDPMVPEPSEAPAPAEAPGAAELERIAGEAMALPGALSASADGVRVVVEVVHDDGSLQAWADETYGADVVHVVTMLVPAV